MMCHFFHILTEVDSCVVLTCEHRIVRSCICVNSINAVGVDIAAFSAMKNEEEVLLLPGLPLTNRPGENPEPGLWTFEVETSRPSADPVGPSAAAVGPSGASVSASAAVTVGPPAVTVESSAAANVGSSVVTVEPSSANVGPSSAAVGPSADPVDSPSVMIDYVHPGTLKMWGYHYICLFTFGYITLLLMYVQDGIRYFTTQIGDGSLKQKNMLYRETFPLDLIKSFQHKRWDYKKSFCIPTRR